MEQKDVYLESMKDKLDRSAALIDALKAQAEQADPALKPALDRRIAELEEQQSRLRARIAGMTTAAAWSDLRHGVESAWDDLGDALEAAVDKFK